MPLPAAVNIGTAPNSGNGDPNRTAFDKLNKRDDWLDANKAPVDSPKIQTRVDLSAVNFSASFRDDGTGNLGWYIGAASAADGAQVKVASVDKVTGEVAFANEVSDKVSLSVSGFGYRFFSAGTESFNGFAALRRGGDGLETVRVRSNGTSYFNGGNVGIGTSTPQALFHVGGTIIANGHIAVLNDVGGALTVGRYNSGYGGAAINAVNTQNPGAGDPSFLDLQIGGITSLRVSTASTHLGTDNTRSLGEASARLSVVYAGTGAINTSDAREKVTPDGEAITEETGWGVTPPTEAELRVARRLHAALGFFKFKDAVAAKGPERARRHFGLTVQFALQVCEEEGVDPWSIGIFCRDEITRKVMKPQTVIEQKTEPDPEFDIVVEVIDGIPTQVRKARPDKPVFKMEPLIGLDGEIVTQTVIVEAESGFPVERQEPVLHPVPVMIEVTRDDPVEEPDGERLGFRYDQLNLFMLRGMLAPGEALEA